MAALRDVAALACGYGVGPPPVAAPGSLTVACLAGAGIVGEHPRENRRVVLPLAGGRGREHLGSRLVPGIARRAASEPRPTFGADDGSLAGAAAAIAPHGGRGWWMTRVRPPPAPAPCQRCEEKGPCRYLKNKKKGCLKGDACEFCHNRSHTRVRKTKYQRDRDCFRCWERGPCASIRGSCTSGAACECCHSHALAEGRSSEYQRATARHVGSSDRIAGAAALPLPRARGAHPTFLEPAQCRCAECGSPSRVHRVLQLPLQRCSLRGDDADWGRLRRRRPSL